MEYIQGINNKNNKDSEHWTVKIKLNPAEIKFKFDLNAKVLPKNIYVNLFPQLKLENTWKLTNTRYKTQIKYS